jgi:hypothetical protein
MENNLIMAMEVSLPVPEDKQDINRMLYKMSDAFSNMLQRDFPEYVNWGRAVVAKDMEGNVIELPLPNFKPE